MPKSGNGGGGGEITPTHVEGVTTASSSQFFERAWPGLSTIFKETRKKYPKLPIAYRDVFEISTPTTQCKTAIGPCLPGVARRDGRIVKQGCKCWICGAPIYIKKDGKEFTVPEGTSEKKAIELLQKAVINKEMANTIKSPHCEHQIPVLPATIILGGLIEAKTFKELESRYPGIANAIRSNYSYAHGEENIVKKNDSFINDDGSINEENMKKVLETVFWRTHTVQGSEVDSIKKYLDKSYPRIWKDKKIFKKWMADRVLAMTSTLEPSILFYKRNMERGAELDALAGTALATTKLKDYIESIRALAQKPGPNQAGYVDFFNKIESFQPEVDAILEPQPGRGVSSPYLLDPTLLEKPEEFSNYMLPAIAKQYLLTGPFVNAFDSWRSKRDKNLDTQIPLFFNQLFNLTGGEELFEKTDQGGITRKVINFTEISEYIKNLLSQNQDIIGINEILPVINAISLLAGKGKSKEVLAKFKFGYAQAISATRALMFLVDKFINLIEQADFQSILEELNLILYGSNTEKEIKYRKVENGFIVYEDEDEDEDDSNPSLLKSLYQALNNLYSTYRVQPIEDETKQPILCLTTSLLNDTAQTLSDETLPDFLTRLFKGQEQYLRFPLEIMLQTKEVVKLQPLEIQISERMPGGKFKCAADDEIKINNPSELGEATQNELLDKVQEEEESIEKAKEYFYSLIPERKRAEINAMLLKADETRAARREAAAQKIQEAWTNYIDRKRDIAELQERRLEIAREVVASKPDEVVAADAAEILQAMLKDQQGEQQLEQSYLQLKKGEKPKKPVVVEDLPPLPPWQYYMRGKKPPSTQPTQSTTIEEKLFENPGRTRTGGGKKNKKTRTKKPRSIKKKIRKSRKRTVRKYKKK